MENIFYYLTLLACPLMIVVLFFFMKGMKKGNDQTKQSVMSQEQIQQNMNDLLEQNRKLINDMEEMKKVNS